MRRRRSAAHENAMKAKLADIRLIEILIETEVEMIVRVFAERTHSRDTSSRIRC